MYVVARLDREQLASYSELTFASFRDSFASERPDAIVAVGAGLFGTPIGLIWGTYAANSALGDIRTIYLKRKYRGKGIGRAMLEEMERAYADLGCKEVSFQYREHAERSPMWEKLFLPRGWSRSRRALHTYTIDIGRMMETAWARRHIRLPEGYSFFRWGELTDKERAMVDAGKDVWYPAEMWPFYHEEWLEPNLSVGLRFGTDIVGWTIVHYMDGITLRADRMFVRPPHQSQGRAVSVMLEASRRSVEANYKYGQFFVSGDNAPMLRIVERRLEPHVLDSYVTIKLVKRLGQSGGDRDEPSS